MTTRKLSKADEDLQAQLESMNLTKTTQPAQLASDKDKQSRKLQEALSSTPVDVNVANQARLHEKAIQISQEGKGEKLQVPPEEEETPPSGTGGAIAKTASNIQENVEAKLTPAANKIGSLRTVGGLGLLFTILFILLVAIVRVNSSGDTRLKQFWYMLNGRATLQGRVVPAAQTGAQGSSADFGTNPQTSGQSSANFGTGSGGPFVSSPGFMMQSPYRNNGVF